MEWVVREIDNKFVVGKSSREKNLFDPICSCEFYDQAELILAALKHYIYPKNYSSRGVAGCPRAIAKNLRLTAMTGLPV